MNKGNWGWALAIWVLAGCERDDVPPMPVAAAEPAEAAPLALPPEAPSDPVKDLRDALAGTRLLDDAIRVAKLQRGSPNLEQGACMARFMSYRPQREAAIDAFRALPKNTPGATELWEAAHEAAWCINCAPGDEARCAKAGRLLALGTRKLKTVTKGLE